MTSWTQPRLVLLTSCTVLALAACGQTSTSSGASATAPPGEQATPSASFSPVAEATTPATPAPSKAPSETDVRAPRLATTYDGGILLLDALTGAVLGDLPATGFTRLNSAGDERHLLVSEQDDFRALDLGAWTEPHGDHGHRYVGNPAMTGIRFASKKPGHVVVHDGLTVLYGDGNGKVESFTSASLVDGQKPSTTVWTDPKPHHGVAVIRKDGSMITTTVGANGKAGGVTVLDVKRAKVAENKACPGTHGEAAAADGVIVVGCQDGILIVKGTTITKVPSPDGYGRIGNQAGSEKSPVVLGDYKTEKDAELERPRRVSLTDTRTGSLRLVDLPASYSFRSLGRGPTGEGLVLGTDGTLRVMDVDAGKVAKEIAVTAPWEEPMEWQQPRPTLYVQDGTAYVTEPSRRLLHFVDLSSASVTKTVQLPRVPNEIKGTRG